MIEENHIDIKLSDQILNSKNPENNSDLNLEEFSKLTIAEVCGYLNNNTHNITNHYIEESNFIPIEQSSDLESDYRLEREEELSNGFWFRVYRTEKFRYIGETNGACQREGFGVCHYNNGIIYKGLWRNDKKTGYGITINNNIEAEVLGELRDDHYEGYIELKHTTSNKKRTFVKKGIINSEGNFAEVISIELIKNNSRILYEGTVAGGLIDFGRIIYSSSKVYYGEIKNMIEDGWGIFVSKNSFIFQGEIKHKVFSGYGEHYHSDLNRYFGFFKKSKKHGLGILIHKDGKLSLSNYVEDFKDGPCFVVTKSNFKMELNHLGLKSKSVDKLDVVKKYVYYNYPEYYKYLDFNFKYVIEKFEKIVESDEIYFKFIEDYVLNDINSVKIDLNNKDLIEETNPIEKK